VIARTSSSAWVRGVVEMFEAEGIDRAALFREARLSPHVLDDPDGRFSIDEVSLLWELAVARSGKTTLGLSKELAARYGMLGVVGYAMMASPTVLAALQQLTRYMNVVSNAATCAVIDAPAGHWFMLGHAGGERPVPRQRVEFGMLTLLSFCGWICGRELQPRLIEFVYPEPEDLSTHSEVYGCPLKFGQPANRALLDAAELAWPLAAHDPQMAALHSQLVERALEKVEQARTSLRLRELLAARAALGEPRREQMAVALGISDRTLQRRLHAEGTSFQQVLDDTRRELAQQYLRTPCRTLGDVAARLGYEDQSTFFRACKRWFGEPPGRYRARFLAPLHKAGPGR